MPKNAAPAAANTASASSAAAAGSWYKPEVRFWLGLGIGLVLGAGAMYLAVGRRGAAAPPAALQVALATPDAGAPHRRGRHHHGGRGRTERVAIDLGDAPPPVLTDADRKPASEGDRVSVQPRAIDMASADDARPLSAGEISAGLDGGADALQHCIASSVAGAELHASITMQLEVDGGGHVTKVRVEAPHWLLAHGLYPCLRGAARRLSFPATGAPTVVTEPFTLD